MQRKLLTLVFVLLCSLSAAFADIVVIVRLPDNPADKTISDRIARAKSIATDLGAKVLDGIPRRNLFLFDLPALQPFLNQAVKRGIRFAEVNARIKLNAAAGGQIISSGAKPQNWYTAQPAFWLVGVGSTGLTANGSGVVVADIDGLVDYSHPALAGSLTSGYDFVLGRAYVLPTASLDQASSSFLDQSSSSFLDQSSSSFLDGTITSFDSPTNNFLNAAGVTMIGASTLSPQASETPYSHGTLAAGVIHAIAPQSMIMPLRAFDDDGNTDMFTIAKAIDFAVANGAQVINMSFGWAVNSPTVSESIDAAQAAGVTMVASAGNANSSTPQYPAAYSSVISVASTDNYDVKSSFSNYGQQVAVSAPGVNIISSFPGGYYAVVSGTSFSSPIVAGEAALLRSVQVDPQAGIRQDIVNIDANNAAYLGGLGSGRVTLSRSVSNAFSAIASSGLATVSLGAAGPYGILSGAGVTNSGPTTINGSLGSNPTGTLTGAPTVAGATDLANPAAVAAKLALAAAYTDAAGRTVNSISLPGNLNGLTLAPGLYTNASSVMLPVGGTVTLDAQGNANAIWIFQMGSTLITFDSSQMVLAGGAKAANIFWQVGSSATLGTNSVFKGTILAAISISINTGAVIEGRALAQTGAVTMLSNMVTVPNFISNPPSGTAAVSLGAAGPYGILSGAGVTNSGPTIINGSLGTTPTGTLTGAPTVTGSTDLANAAATAAKLALSAAYSDAAGRTANSISLPASLDGLVLVPGLYTNASAVMLPVGGIVILDAQGNPNAVWIFQMGSTLITFDSSQMVLSGGAKAANIFWQVGSSATLGTNSVFKGNILAAVSISLNTGAVVEGRALAQAGAVTLLSNTVSVPLP